MQEQVISEVEQLLGTGEHVWTIVPSDMGSKIGRVACKDILAAVHKEVAKGKLDAAKEVERLFSDNTIDVDEAQAQLEALGEQWRKEAGE